MDIAENEVQYFADIAQIGLTNDEIIELSDNMNRIITYIKDKLDEADKLDGIDTLDTL
ncbi:MAG: hypothetical protein PHQ11_15975 [Paludibacter sp.]|nr:hypothetical protein [Paludibacter sp.]MDD4295562.1 hypothetical protein [Ruminiclostridium sp.]